MTYALAIMGVLILIATVITIFSITSRDPTIIAALSGMGVVYLLLAFGVYKRSRVVASLVLAFFSMSAIGLLMKSGTEKVNMVTLGLTVLLVFVSLRGTLATFRHHRHKATLRARSAGTHRGDDPAFAQRIEPKM